MTRTYMQNTAIKNKELLDKLNYKIEHLANKGIWVSNEGI